MGEALLSVMDVNTKKALKQTPTASSEESVSMAWPETMLKNVRNTINSFPIRY